MVPLPLGGGHKRPPYSPPPTKQPPTKPPVFPGAPWSAQGRRHRVFPPKGGGPVLPPKGGGIVVFPPKGGSGTVVFPPKGSGPQVRPAAALRLRPRAAPRRSRTKEAVIEVDGAPYGGRLRVRCCS